MNSKLSLRDTPDVITAVAFSPDGATLVSADWDGMMYLWDMSTRERHVTLSGHTGRIFATVFSYDGSRVASISYDDTIRVWDTHTGELQATFDRQGADGLTFLPDGSLRACGGWKGLETLRVWDVYTEESVTPEIGTGFDPGLNTVVAFSPG